MRSKIRRATRALFSPALPRGGAGGGSVGSAVSFAPGSQMRLAMAMHGRWPTADGRRPTADACLFVAPVDRTASSMVPAPVDLARLPVHVVLDLHVAS